MLMVPSTRLFLIAPVGHASTHLGMSQWLQATGIQ
jgi:hypothetical protein